MSKNQEWENVLDIADGRPRGECVRRAVQAFAHANEVRARYTSLLEAGKRADAITQALSWCEVLQYLDATGATVFSQDAYEDRPTLPWWRRVLHRLNLAGWFTTVTWSVRASFGTKPIEFYQLEEGGENDAADHSDKPGW